MRKRTTAVIAIVAMLFAVSFALPATGATPSIGKVFNRAKKALRIAKRANRRAKKALARPVVTVSGIQAVQGPTNTIASGDVGFSIAFCPTGFRVVSGGGELITGAFDGLAASEANGARTSWFVVGGNNSSISGSIKAVAYCAAGGQAVGAHSDRAATARQIQRMVERLEKARK